MQLRRSAVVLVSVVGLGACGGARSSEPPATAPARPVPQRNLLALPPGVPRTPTGPADPAATRTIRGWARALDAGRVARASAFWAVPARIQNGTRC